MPATGIREEVSPTDADRVQALVEATGFFNAEEIAIARELVEENLRRGIGSGYRFAFADAGDDLAGYVCFGLIPATASSFHLYWIAVAPTWQGQGLGRRLLDYALAAIHRAGGERLYSETSTRPQYAPTRAFYEAMGFRLIASLPEYFAPGEGKAIYERSIGNGGRFNLSG